MTVIAGTPMPELILQVAGPNGPEATHVRKNRLVVAERALVGFLAAYPSGWYAYSLTNPPVLTVNRASVVTPVRLRVGDVLATGGPEILVLSSVPPDDLEARLVGPRCSVRAAVRGQTWELPDAGSPIRIGSAPACDLVIPAEGIERVHALLAYADDLWHVHDVTGRHHKVTQLSAERPERSAVVVSGATMWVGDLELTVTCAPLDRVGPADFAAPPPPAEAPETDADAVSLRDRPTTPSVSATVTHRPSRSDATHERGFRLCQWIKDQMGTPATGEPTGGAGGWPPADPLLALDYYQDRLTAHPASRDLLFAVADCFVELGFVDLERVVLKEMLRHHSTDFPLLVRLTERLFEFGCQPNRPAEDRADDLRRADKYAGKALALRPDAWDVADLRQRVAVELTLVGLPAPVAGGATE